MGLGAGASAAAASGSRAAKRRGGARANAAAVAARRPRASPPPADSDLSPPGSPPASDASHDIVVLIDAIDLCNSDDDDTKGAEVGPARGQPGGAHCHRGADLPRHGTSYLACASMLALLCTLQALHVPVMPLAAATQPAVPVATTWDEESRHGTACLFNQHLPWS